MIILDTNVISELTKDQIDPSVTAWSQHADWEEKYLCAPVIAELQFGAVRFKARTGSNSHGHTLDRLLAGPFLGKILPMDTRAAMFAGQFRAHRENAGRPVKPMDMAIAGIAAANNATLATRNVRDFEGLDLKLVNPFEA